MSSLYPVLKRLLFKLDPETTHDLSMLLLKTVHRAGMTRLFGGAWRAPYRAMGIDFENRVGLAAGFDKNGDFIDSLGSLGFGFIEVGTVTPRPQPGNDKPRLFRLPRQRAVINRMGFNNKGVDHLVSQLQKARFKGVVGVNIGKNLATSIENAHEDYLHCLRRVYASADYVTVNVSSPNTPGLRSLQRKEHLAFFLDLIGEERGRLAQRHGKFVPVLVKVSPDESESQLADFARVFNDSGMDGLIAVNTTLCRKGVEDSVHAAEAGGLSGAPLKKRAEKVLRILKSYINKDATVIASGGILSTDDALARVRAGADLVQVYTGLIYAGPGLVKDISRRLETG